MTDRIVKVVLRGDIGDLLGKLRATSAGINSVVGTMTSGTREAKAWRQNLSTLGDTAGKFGLVAAAGVAVAVKSFADFDEAMSHVAATGSDARGSIDELRKAAIDFGASTQFSATEAANAIEEMAKAGVSAKDILGGGLKGALDLAAAGGLNVADAAEIAATAVNQFALSGSDVPHVADLLAAAANAAQGGVADLAGALKYAGVPAKSLGISIEETTAVLAEFASKGIVGEQAGTTLRSALISLAAPSKIASKELEAYNVQLYDANGKFIGLSGAAEELHTKLGGLTEAERNQALGRIFGNEALQGAITLYEGGGAAVESWRKKTDVAGAAAAQAALRMDNLKGDIEKLSGAFQTAFISTGDGANGPLREMVQLLTKLIDGYNALPGPVKSGALAVAGLTAALGGTVFVASRVIDSVARTKEGMAGLGVSFENANKRALALRGGALALGLGLASISGKATDSSAGLGALTSAASGVALGLAAGGGPFTAAIGGAIGLFSGLKASSAAARQSLQDLTATLDQQTGAVTANTAVWVAKKLQDADMVETLGQVGISLKTATDAALGNKDAISQVADATKGASFEQTVALASVLGLNKAVVDGKEKTLALGAATDGASAATAGAATSFGGAADAAENATMSIKDMKSALDGLLDPTLNQDQATVAWRRSIQGLTEEIAKNGGNLDLNTKQGQDNRDAIRDRVSALKESVEADLAAGGAQDDATAKLQRGAKQILDTATAAGIAKGDVRAYLKTLGLTPAELKTVFDVETAHATAAIAGLQQKINDIHGKTVGIHIQSSVGGGTTTRDADGSIHTAKGRITHFADGGENHVAQIGDGHTRVWNEPETGGEAYIPLAMAKRKRSQQIALQTVSRLGGVAYFANGGTTGNQPAAPVVTAAPLDYDRLAAAMAKLSVSVDRTVFARLVQSADKFSGVAK